MPDPTIQDLDQLEEFDPNETLILIQSLSTDGDLYKMLASSFVESTFVNSEYADISRTDIGLTSTTIEFTKDYLFNQNSSLEINLDFACDVRLPSVKIIKNSNQNFCRILTYEGVTEITIDDTAESKNLSIYTLADNQETIISGDISFTSGVASSFTISNLKLSNITDLSATNFAYCCAKLRATVIQ